MKKTMTEFYNQIYNLCFIKRYSVIPRLHEESIAEHSFFVSSIVIKLYDDYEFNLGEALIMAVTHDWTESYTDDITVATKRVYPGIAKAVEKAESIIAKKEFSSYVHIAWKAYKDGATVEAKIVKYADTLQVIQYAQNEIKLGNNGYMQSVLSDANNRCYKLEGELYEHKRHN